MPADANSSCFRRPSELSSTNLATTYAINSHAGKTDCQFPGPALLLDSSKLLFGLPSLALARFDKTRRQAPEGLQLSMIECP